MAVIVNQSGAWIQGASYLGYNNLLDKATTIITANRNDDNYPVSNIGTWPTYERYEISADSVVRIFISFPQAEFINSYGIARHNLGDEEMTIRLHSSTDFGASWTLYQPNGISSFYSFSQENETMFFVGNDASVNAQTWRITIDNVPTFKQNNIRIGNIFLGNSLKLFSPPDRGFVPPDLAMKDEFTSNVSEGGDYLGRTLLRKAAETQFKMSNVAESWVNDEWKACMRAVQEHPFYFGWDVVNHPLSVAYCYTERTIDHPKYSDSGFYTVPLKFRALS